MAEARETVEGLRDEEQEFYDNMPEGFQNGEKGEAAQAAVSNLEDAIVALENIEGMDLDEMEVSDVDVDGIDEASASLDSAENG